MDCLNFGMVGQESLEENNNNDDHDDTNYEYRVEEIACKVFFYFSGSL